MWTLWTFCKNSAALLSKTECAILPDCALLIVMRAVGGVNLSDFCRYYQQPTNNTPELALRIGSRLQNLLQHWPLVFRFALRCFRCILCCRLYSACIPLRRFRCIAAAIAYIWYRSSLLRFSYCSLAGDIISVRLPALAASLSCCVCDGLDKASWWLMLRTFSCSQLLLKNIDTFLRK